MRWQLGVASRLGIASGLRGAWGNQQHLHLDQQVDVRLTLVHWIEWAQRGPAEPKTACAGLQIIGSPGDLHRGTTLAAAVRSAEQDVGRRYSRSVK